MSGYDVLVEVAKRAGLMTLPDQEFVRMLVTAAQVKSIDDVHELARGYLGFDSRKICSEEEAKKIWSWIQETEK